jgi:hypothetical protein
MQSLATQVLFDIPHMEDDMTDQPQEIWSIIWYLDPGTKDSATDIAAFIQQGWGGYPQWSKAVFMVSLSRKLQPV